MLIVLTYVDIFHLKYFIVSKKPVPIRDQEPIYGGEICFANTYCKYLKNWNVVQVSESEKGCKEFSDLKDMV